MHQCTVSPSLIPPDPIRAQKAHSSSFEGFRLEITEEKGKKWLNGYLRPYTMGSMANQERMRTAQSLRVL